MGIKMIDKKRPLTRLVAKFFENDVDYGRILNVFIRDYLILMAAKSNGLLGDSSDWKFDNPEKGIIGLDTHAAYLIEKDGLINEECQMTLKGKAFVSAVNFFEQEGME